MKIAISSTGSSLDDQIDPRFGRCAYFILIDPETMEYEAIPNQNVVCHQRRRYFIGPADVG